MMANQANITSDILKVKPKNFERKREQNSKNYVQGADDKLGQTLRTHLKQ